MALDLGQAGCSLILPFFQNTVAYASFLHVDEINNSKSTVYFWVRMQNRIVVHVYRSASFSRLIFQTSVMNVTQ